MRLPELSGGEVVQDRKPDELRDPDEPGKESARKDVRRAERARVDRRERDEGGEGDAEKAERDGSAEVARGAEHREVERGEGDPGDDADRKEDTGGNVSAGDRLCLQQDTAPRLDEWWREECRQERRPEQQEPVRDARETHPDGGASVLNRRVGVALPEKPAGRCEALGDLRPRSVEQSCEYEKGRAGADMQYPAGTEIRADLACHREHGTGPPSEWARRLCELLDAEGTCLRLRPGRP